MPNKGPKRKTAQKRPIKKASGKPAAPAKKSAAATIPASNPHLKDLIAADYVVAFLDLLGYREMLRSFDFHPIPEDAPTQKKLRDGLVEVVKLRRRMMGIAKSFLFGAEIKIPPEANALHDKAKTAFLESRKAKIYKDEGPDHIVLGASCAPTPGEHFPARGIFALFTGASVLATMQLYMGGDSGLSLPLRGGIGLGPGMLADLADGDDVEELLYSSALMHAYDIESKTAYFPRIVVHRRVVDYLDALKDDPDPRALAVMQRTLAAKCRAMVVKDPTDDQYMLDFFGKELAEVAGSNLPPGMAAKTRQFVKDCFRDAQIRRRLALDKTYEMESEREAEEKKHNSIVKKYEWLDRYMEDRVQFWPDQ